VGIIYGMSLTDRENWIYFAITNGNVPNFVRTLVPISASANINGTNHTCTYYATPDYMAIGSDSDYFLEPMTPLLAQRLCDTLGCTLPTRKMVNQIWTNASVKMNPQPIPPSAEMITVPVFADHNEKVWSQRQTFTNSFPLGALVSGDKKDVIISTKIYTNFANVSITQPVVIYGWHFTSGAPIQPLYNGHENTYADYSHGVRLVQNAFILDGNANTITNVLPDLNLAKLLSDEGTSEGPSVNGEIKVPRYPVASISPVAPGIFTQPRSQTVLPGYSVFLQVQAAGPPPLRYRWLSNGLAIAGATNTSLLISNVQTASAASYSVIVSNSIGSITSRPAVLRVNTSVRPILFADNFDTNTAANWNLFWGASNNIADYTADWAFDYCRTTYSFNGPGTWIPTAPNSPDGSTRGVRLTVNNNDTNASIAGVNIYPKNQSFSNNFALKFDLWINYPGGAGGSGTDVAGSTEHAIFGLNHLGTEANWAALSSPSTDGIWFGVDGEGGTSRDYRAYVGNSGGTQTELIGQAASGLSESNNALGIYPTLLPSSRFETVGSPGKTWVEVELRQTNNFIFWILDGTIVAQRTNSSSFKSGNIMLGFMDTFPSIANPAEDAFVLYDNVRVEDLTAAALLPPAITLQPTNQTAIAGSNATFSVVASGSGPLSYQWRRNGASIVGATTSSLVLTNVQLGDASAYDVIVTNLAGLATSAAATLTVNLPPPEFVSATMLPNGQFQLLFSGVPGTNYTVEASTNLINWTFIATLTPSNNPVPFIDPDATNFVERFYRAH